MSRVNEINRYYCWKVFNHKYEIRFFFEKKMSSITTAQVHLIFFRSGVDRIMTGSERPNVVTTPFVTSVVAVAVMAISAAFGSTDRTAPIAPY